MRVHAFDEMSGTVSGGAAAPIRAAYAKLKRWLDEAPSDLIDARRSQAELFFRRIGITFAVYGDNEAERTPDPVRHHSARADAAGMGHLRTRPGAARHRAQRLPERHLRRARDASRQAMSRRTWSTATRASARRWRPQVPHDIYVHIAGIDIVRVDADNFYVLEDNARTPVRRLLHAGEPRGDDAALPGAVRRPPRRAGRELSGRAAGDAALGRAAPALRRPDRACC